MDKIHGFDRPAAQALQSGMYADNGRKKNRKNRKYVYSSEEASGSDESGHISLIRIFYPHETTVYRNAWNLTRVIQPVNVKSLLAKGGSPVFRITEDRTNAFGITSIAGIVYVKNTTALQTAPEMLY